MSGPGAQPGEPVIELVRFNQAVNRLEVLRGMRDVPDRLVSRLLRKYPVINMRMDGRNFRMFEYPEERPSGRVSKARRQ